MPIPPSVLLIVMVFQLTIGMPLPLPLEAQMNFLAIWDIQVELN